MFLLKDSRYCFICKSKKILINSHGGEKLHLGAVSLISTKN